MTRDHFLTAAFFICLCLGLAAYLGDLHGEKTGYNAGALATYDQNFGNATFNLYTTKQRLAALKTASR